MGELHLHNLDQYKCNVFIETGTGVGTGLAYALTHNFNKLYSIEINHQLYLECSENFNDARLELMHKTSLAGLKAILPELDENDRVLFWLDAHFPGADFQLGSYDDEISDILKFPLQSEIELIHKIRKDCKDVFIIDDLQLFEEGDYELEWSQEFIDKFRRSNEFIYDKFSKTHKFTKDYRHQGFLILEPNNDTDSP